jgi:hypothetical protein
MTRIRAGAIILGLAVFLTGSLAHAQAVTGKIVGRVLDKDTSQPLSGVTVIVQGPQGEEAALTDDKGSYFFSGVPIGTYVIRFFVATSSAKVEQPNVIVSADKTVRVNARIPSQAAAAAEETYVIERKAPAVDIGSARAGLVISEDFHNNVPVGRTFGEMIEKAPGAFTDRSNSVSIAGSTGFENIYIVDGLNVTGIEQGDLGSNFVTNFIKEVEINSGAYNAEYGGAMGGVVNVVTKSGGNEFHGSVFSYWSPYWLSGEPNQVPRLGQPLVGQRKPDYDSNIGAEVGGPLIKDKLFFWVGFSPRFQKNHFFQITQPLVPDSNGDGIPENGPETARVRIDEPGSTYQYAAKMDFIPATDHRLSLGLFGSPSSIQTLKDADLLSNPQQALQQLDRNTTDVMVRSVSKFMDRKWQVEVNLGLHREDYEDKSPDGMRNSINQLEFWGDNLFNIEQTPGCATIMNGADTFDPCPVNGYRTGGYGLLRSYDANRWMGELKSSHIFRGGGQHEIKYGAHYELNQLNLQRSYTGPMGQRALIQNYADHADVWTFFSLPQGQSPFQRNDAIYDDMTGALVNDDPNMDGRRADLVQPGYYQDVLNANTKTTNTAFFLQDSYSVLPNLNVNAGVRYEMQNLYDFRGQSFMDLNNFGPRIGVIYDPTNEGRSKVYGHYGRFFEAIPLVLNSRYFGGEGIVIRSFPADPMSCANPGQNWNTCPAPSDPAQINTFNNGTNYPVQANIKGQSHDEIVAGAQYEVIEDLTVGAQYTHRNLNAVIEDGTAADDFYFVLANPGQIPQDVINQAQADATAKQAESDRLAMDPNATPAQQAAAAAAAGEAASRQRNLAGLAALPKPTRNYNAVTLSAAKRFSKNWLMHASYTYSRVIGNYNGLYDPDFNYTTANGTSAFDVPDLTLNRYGPLANDRPHLARLDGFYQIPIGKGSLVTGLGVSARSGQPRNYVGYIFAYGDQSFLLPRGSAGRTPAVTQFDLKLSYRRPIKQTMYVEAFIDLFNVFNQKATLRTDDVYTFDLAAPIVNGDINDLAHAKNIEGNPLSQNANFGRALAYQRPFNGRLGLRLGF